MALRIVGVAGSKVGQAFELSGEVTVGRAADCSISLPHDAAVSRQHARFTWIQGLPMVEDLGSRNGTFLNGARITQARPVSSGDEVRIGGEVFRVEAVLDSVPGQVPAGPAKEVSRGERGAQGRPGERSGAEGTLYQNVGGADGPGCALPSIDLSGCLKYIWMILLILLVALAIAAILWGLGTLLSGLGGASSAVSGQGAGPGASSRPDSGSQPPPPVEDNKDQDQKQPSAEGIRIDEVKVDFAKRNGPDLRPVVLVKWTNLTKKPVARLFGTVQILDQDGKLLAEIPRETIYHGPPVSPGEEHQDDRERDGIVIQRKLSGTPTSAKVKVERVE